jgi:hypothetical protein
MPFPVFPPLSPGNVFSENHADGIWINSTGSGNIVRGNLIGTDITGMKGTSGPYTTGNYANGIEIIGNQNTIGDATSLTGRNIISANLNPIQGGASSNGIKIDGSSLEGNSNQVVGNYIGLTQDGSAPLGNQGMGVEIYDGSSNTIGGYANVAGTPPGNVISANQSGIWIFGDGKVAAANNMVEGNLIGTDSTGKLGYTPGPMANSFGNGTGVRVIGTGPNDTGNQIGAVLDDFGRGGNVISNNGDGVYLSANKTDVWGNYIGTDITGANGLGNTSDGIQINPSGYAGTG